MRGFPLHTRHGFLMLMIMVTPMISVAQESLLKAFHPLVGKVWKAEGNWSNGTKFVQEVVFTYDLDQSIIVTNTKGFTDKDQNEFGNRSHGVRLFSSETGQIEFWEFDRFGGVTHGEIRIDGSDFYYKYNYGESVLTDCWEYIDHNTYTFTVGVYDNDKWETIYLKTEFKAEKL